MADAIHEQVAEVIPSAALAKAKFSLVFARAVAALEDGYAVELTAKPLKTTRSLQANAAMWAHLSDISKQVVWHGSKLPPESWKEILSASLKKQTAVPGIDGGFVILGVRTSRMSIKEMSTMIELCVAFGAQQGVKFAAPKYLEEIS